MEIAEWNGERARAEASRVWGVYDPVFADQPDEATWTASSLEPQSRRQGFVLVAALDADRLVGFGWGFVGRRGQFWPDRVAEALGPDLAETWVGGHWEVVELAVLPDARGTGLGRRLLSALVAHADGRRSLLSTDDADTPAVRLYRSTGWRTLGLLAPGTQVMGLAPARV